MEFSAQQISLLLGGKIKGDPNRKVSDVGAIETAKEGQLTFLCDAKYISHLPSTKASVVLMTESIPFEGETDATIIRVENARAAMGQLLTLVAKALNPVKKGIDEPLEQWANINGYISLDEFAKKRNINLDDSVT